MAGQILIRQGFAAGHSAGHEARQLFNSHKNTPRIPLAGAWDVETEMTSGLRH